MGTSHRSGGRIENDLANPSRSLDFSDSIDGSGELFEDGQHAGTDDSANPASALASSTGSAAAAQAALSLYNWASSVFSDDLDESIGPEDFPTLLRSSSSLRDSTSSFDHSSRVLNTVAPTPPSNM